MTPLKKIALITLTTLSFYMLYKYNFLQKTSPFITTLSAPSQQPAQQSLPSQPTNPLVIEPLNGRKELIEPLMQLHADEWKTTQLQTILEHDRSTDQQLPFTYVVLYNGDLVGSCSLVATCNINTTLSPWAEHLYISPAYRGKKIAKKLILAILQKTKDLGYNALYFWTNKPENISIYEHMGGTIIQRTHHFDGTCVIMQRILDDFTTHI